MWWRKGNKKHILVLFHENETRSFIKKIYAISKFYQPWKEAGFKVTLQRGIKNRPDADLLFVHVNLSVIPAPYREFIRHYSQTINGDVVDISKRFISDNIIDSQDNFDGEVIVKSNLNCSGNPEKKRFRMKTSLFPLDSYKIYQHPKDVPAIYWDHSEIVIEKFLPETEDNAYFIRHYLFLGDEEVWIRVKSTDPIVKANTIIEYTDIEPDPVIRQIRKKLNFDYGKFDYVVHKGQPILFDANKTQGGGLLAFSQFNESTYRRAMAVKSFFAG